MKRQRTGSARRAYSKTGYHSLVGALKGGGLAGVDRRTALARSLAADRAELEAHLGGEPSVTERRSIEAVQHLDLLIGAGAAGLARVGPVDRKRHAFRPLARELAGLLESRRRLCLDLGWRPRQKPALSLSEYLAERAAAAVAQEPPADAPTPQEPEPVPGEALEAAGEAQESE